ncbi:MAG: amidotransferase 1, exosortase A system-associated [Kiloniellales bacterium]|nr:amidotransferase 1, exosortase A system-associated [Kiloniellales bacterium]
MCGLVGLFDMRARREPDRRLIDRMTERLAHRGPDGRGKHIAPGIGLGHTRLAIIDIKGGAQPLFNESGTTSVVFNGEIYNFREIRRELQAMGRHFRTDSDTEVIVHAWDAWGRDCVRHLAGMFAFALFDEKRECLFLARDRMGEKPLYYAELDDGWLLFGSELKALEEHPDLPRRLDFRAVEDFFTYGYIPDPKTIIEGVHKLEPASSFTLQRGRPAIKEHYWKFRMTEDLQGDPGELADELKSRLKVSVERQMIADVPLGAFLSGGLDSSAIVSAAASLHEEDLQSYTISFEDPRFDEGPHAKKVANFLGTDHHDRTVAPVPGDYLGKIIDIFDEPFADSSALPTFVLSAFAREDIKVALSGDGGDELFAGYRRYPWHSREERLRRLAPGPLRRSLFGSLARLYPKADWAPRMLRAKTAFHELSLGSLEGYLSNLAFCSEGVRQTLFSKALQKNNLGYDPIEVISRHAGESGTEHPLLQAQYIDLKTYLPGDILVKVDRSAMANSLEVRVPLLDHEFVEWVCRLPADLKLRGRQSKWLFKRALAGQLPQEIIDRPKQGFSIPLAAWLRGPLRADLEAALQQESLWDCGLFDQEGLRKLFTEHMRATGDHSAALWGIIVFSNFLKRGYEARL